MSLFFRVSSRLQSQGGRLWSEYVKFAHSRAILPRTPPDHSTWPALDVRVGSFFYFTEENARNGLDVRVRV